jgi:hypothetical protein
MLQISMVRKVKVSSRLPSSRTTCSSSFQTECFHGSAFIIRTKQFQILVPVVLISSIMPRNVSNYFTPVYQARLQDVLLAKVSNLLLVFVCETVLK